MVHKMLNLASNEIWHQYDDNQRDSRILREADVNSKAMLPIRALVNYTFVKVW